MAAFLLTWGLLNFLWLALLRRPALSAALSFAMLVIAGHGVALQVRDSLDDGELRRRHDHRFRHLCVPLAGLSQRPRGARSRALPWRFRSRVLIWRIDPFRVRRRIGARGRGGLLRCAHRARARRSDASWRGLRRRELLVRLRALRRRCGVGLHGGRISGIGSGGRRRAAPRAPMTPARPRARVRTSSCCTTNSSFDIRVVDGHQGAAGLRPPLPVVRRQGAQVPGRRRRRPELVHRVQRARGTVVALLRPLSVLRHAHRRRPRRRAACRTRSSAAATGPSRSIRPTAPSWARAASTRAPASQTFHRRQGHRRRRVRAGQFLFRSSPRA